MIFKSLTVFPLYWGFLVGDVSTHSAGEQTPPLICKLVSLDSAQWAITSVFLLFLLGFWLFFSPQKRDFQISTALVTWMGDMSSVVPPAERGKGERGMSVPGNVWRPAQLQGALAVRCFPRAGLLHKEMLAGPQERDHRCPCCVTFLWECDLGICKTVLTPPFLIPAVTAKSRP